MHRLSVLIITDEPIFSFGLRVQLQQWGFARTEITNTCELGLQNLHKQLPALIIIDEKMLHTQACGSIELITGVHAIPAILLSVNAEQSRPLEGIWELNKNYTYVNKPCKIADLQAAVESLLQLNLNILQE